MVEGLDQYAVFGRTLHALHDARWFTLLDPSAAAIHLRAAFRRDFMAWRPSDHWAQFEQAPLTWWISVVARFEAGLRPA